MADRFGQTQCPRCRWLEYNLAGGLVCGTTDELIDLSRQADWCRQPDAPASQPQPKPEEK